MFGAIPMAAPPPPPPAPYLPWYHGRIMIESSSCKAGMTAHWNNAHFPVHSRFCKRMVVAKHKESCELCR
jgi:hypothetical protein